jgi:predicted nucleotidyltransferase
MIHYVTDWLAQPRQAMADKEATTAAAAGQEEELRLRAKERAAGALSFAELCHRLERVSHEVRQRDRKLDVLFPRSLRIALHNQSPYPLFRLLLPHIDNARGNYQIKQATLAR